MYNHYSIKFIQLGVYKINKKNIQTIYIYKTQLLLKDCTTI